MVEDCKKAITTSLNALSNAEIVVILRLFHYDCFCYFKHCYLHYACEYLTHLFPNRVAYNLFVE